MTIPIKNLSQGPAGMGSGRLSGAGLGKVGLAGQESNGNSARGISGDQVTLTQRAVRLSELAQSANAQPTVNQERVDALRQAIQEGRYAVNADRVAANLLATEGALW